MGYGFASHTDTEVILKAFHAWGVACVERFRGMFAFVIYDEVKEKLLKIRAKDSDKVIKCYVITKSLNVIPITRISKRNVYFTIQ